MRSRQWELHHCSILYTVVSVETMRGIASHSVCQNVSSFSLDTGPYRVISSTVCRFVDNGLLEVNPDLRRSLLQLSL